MENELPLELRATRSFWPAAGEGEGAIPCLVVIDGQRSSFFPLPHNGVVLIGRGAEVDLQLTEDAASRRHARLVLAQGQVHLVDLDSHNGTWVNGERMAGTRPLESGDAITIGAVTLVLRAAPSLPLGRAPLDAAAWRARFGEELERAARYQRPLAVLAVAHAGHEERATLAAALAGALRPIDLVAATSATELVALLPELGDDAAAEYAQAALAALAEAAPRIGLTNFPDDGCDGDTLLAAARVAARLASPGGVARGRDAITRLHVGERTVIVADPAVSRLYELIERLAHTLLPVLILGESGAGKENAAYAVHAWSARAGQPFVALNCAALQEALVESELFGYERGAFTGAVGNKLGLLERGDGGTVFLDEVSELSPLAQAKLLRVVEHQRLTRLGDVRERAVDIRLVAATNRDLEAEVRAGRFRQDLFFRLSGAIVALPPLRARPREIAVLARHFLDLAVAQAGRAPLTLSPGALHRLGQHAWPGNVRELKHAMEYAAALADADSVEAWHLPDAILRDAIEPGEAEAGDAGAPLPGFRPVAEELRELERRRMAEALRATGGVQRRAAELIGMPLRTFAVKVKQYGLRGS